MLHQAAICKAYFVDPLELSGGRGSALVSQLISEIAGPRVCVLEIERADGRFCLVLDAGWADLGVYVRSISDRSVMASLAHRPLPRAALHAVIAGWPADWDHPVDPELDLHLSDDLIPHVSLADLHVRHNPSHGAHTTA